ncbi:hypothetical protein [Aeromicrobium sp. 179-A 4D2 NHS]|uniref:hypothetical protein n=1 Tax=Aeromicrobium sp. 179-A 4D2 NHS TaxID=3142375 RepID=UPI0039A194DD
MRTRRPSSSSYRTMIVALFAAFAMLFVSATPATAGTFNESKSGSDRASSTTLYYKKAHGNFKLRIWTSIDGPIQIGVTKYSVKFYDNAGRNVWSATDQRDRTYTIGGNVTKIVVKQNKHTQFSKTNWQRK